MFELMFDLKGRVNSERVGRLRTRSVSLSQAWAKATAAGTGD